MEFKRFKYAVGTTISLTGKELQLIVLCSGKHYDHYCMTASQQGGFLWGAMNALSAEANRKHSKPKFLAGPEVFKQGYALKTVFEYDFDAREVDLIRKILEISGSLKTEPGDDEILSDLILKFGNVFKKISEEWQRLNGEPK